MTDDMPVFPTFAAPFHVGRPNIGDRARFLELTQGILDRAWLTNYGPLVQAFEQRLAEYLGVRHCIVTANGTVALELAIRALGLEGEVILPSLTFIATAHALQWQGIRPVFCDIDPDTYNLDPAAVERHITPRTSGLLGVHLYGRACDTDGLEAVARRHGLALMFDAAHAFGCSHQGRMIGHFGACEVFSFHATKVFNSFEGGAVATNDDALAGKIRLMQNFGFAGEDEVIYVGVNGKMPEICAAMGLTNLDSLEGFIAINRRNLEQYRAGLAGLPGIRVIQYPPAERNNYHYLILEVDEARFGLSRDGLKERLRQHHVLARRYFYPGCHRMEPYRTLDPDAGLALPNTVAFSERVLALPTGTQVTPEQIDAISAIIRAAPRWAG
ncbi:MAG: aminotransferase class I/II-fold pyridoxal phosphate-dependent enzyme [Chromatiaceae bacterium]